MPKRRLSPSQLLAKAVKQAVKVLNEDPAFVAEQKAQLKKRRDLLKKQARQIARDDYRNVPNGDVRFDKTPRVRLDNKAEGAWVQSWVWVLFDEPDESHNYP